MEQNRRPLVIAGVAVLIAVVGFGVGWLVGTSAESAGTTTETVQPFRQVYIQDGHTTTQTYFAPATTPVCPTVVEPGVQYVTPCINKVQTITVPPPTGTTTGATTTTP